MGALEGWARKLGLPLLFISAAGWIVYVVGFCLFYHEISAELEIATTTFSSLDGFGSILPTLAPYLTPFWMFLGSGILMYILGILYLLFGNSFLGLATNFFTFISLTTGGIVLFETGVIVFYPAFSVSSSNIAKYIVTTFSGCLVAEVFLGISMLLWPFFIVSQPEFCINLTEEDRQAFGGRYRHHFQPESSSQLHAYSHLDPTTPSPQAVPMAPVAAVPGYTPAPGFIAPNPKGPQHY